LASVIPKLYRGIFQRVGVAASRPKRQHRNCNRSAYLENVPHQQTSTPALPRAGLNRSCAPCVRAMARRRIGTGGPTAHYGRAAEGELRDDQYRILSGQPSSLSDNFAISGGVTDRVTHRRPTAHRDRSRGLPITKTRELAHGGYLHSNVTLPVPILSGSIVASRIEDPHEIHRTEPYRWNIAALPGAPWFAPAGPSAAKAAGLYVQD
jgi:hypothetical protein